MAIKSVRVCAQEGISSSVLWSLAIDDLLNFLHGKSFNVQDYGNNLAVTVKGKHANLLLGSCDKLFAPSVPDVLGQNFMSTHLLIEDNTC